MDNSKIIIDTSKLKLNGEDLQKIGNDYQETLSKVYEDLEKLYTNEEWSSESSEGSANKFKEYISQDKEKALALCENIKLLGTEIMDFSSAMSSISDKTI